MHATQIHACNIHRKKISHINSDLVFKKKAVKVFTLNFRSQYVRPSIPLYQLAQIETKVAISQLYLSLLQEKSVTNSGKLYRSF